MLKVIFAALFAISAASASATQGDNECLMGVYAASQAYTLTVYDAQNPPPVAMARMLDFRISQQPFPTSNYHAGMSLLYIAQRLHDAKIRAVQDWQVSWAAEEYVRKECAK